MSEKSDIEKIVDNSQPKINAYAKYSGLGIQMGIIIFLGVYGGMKLDEYLQLETPWFTVLFSLLSVFLALFVVIRGVLKLTKDK